jgi:hypothetical protein
MRVFVAALLLTGCGPVLSGSLEGRAPFAAARAYLATPYGPISIATADATNQCRRTEQLRSDASGELIFSTGQAGEHAIVPLELVNQGAASGEVALYRDPSGSENEWTGSLRLEAAGTSGIRGWFELKAGASRLDGDFLAVPCP